MTHTAYIRRETLISMVINSVLTLLFFLLLFGGMAHVPLWGMGHWAFDFIPQSLMIALMSTLIPGLLTRRAVASGRIIANGPPSRLPANPVVRAVLVALAVTAIVVALVAAAHFMASADHAAPGTIPFAAALAIKLAYAAVLAAAVTPPGLRAALAAR
jgi:hypothetical protein